MSIVSLLIGLVTGLIIGYWGKGEVNRQLREILTSLTHTKNKTVDFSIPSLIRRELAYLQKQQDKLLSKVELWEKLLLKAPIAYLQVDADNQLIWCNEQARTLLSIDRWQSGQVRLLLELVRSSDLDQLIEKTRLTNSTQTQKWVFYPSHYPSSVVEYDHYKIPIQAYSYPLPGKEVGVFLENQRSLTQAYQRWERSISDLTHELRTPLTSISLLAETLQKRLESREKRWSELILKETKRLIDLIETWLEISQLEENPNQLLKYEEVELSNLVNMAWDALEPIAQSQAITLNYSCSQQIYLQADKSLLTRVFLNIFDNAIKHSQTSGIINVDVQLISQNQAVAIDIIDSGDGFELTDLPHIFERLYRGDHSRSRLSLENPLKSRQGSGLGLSIVQQIIQAHQGSITAQNHPSTQGAWLRVTLPLNIVILKKVF